MKDFLKLDVIVQRIAKKLKGKYKIAKLIKSISFAWFIFTVVATVWSLIPKEEKMPEVDGAELLAAQLEKESAKLEESKSTDTDPFIADFAEPVAVI